ncbi:putative protein phosphatase 2C 14 [Vitis vinifera]|uniref:protein-serine/threonine phosphatase n=1 Tax=Vitis vinifera TaxID=29760 RepID=A0A438J613_VITVI|nr:putative protein phosphatase 2C 14 [Vitis vinifera]
MPIDSSVVADMDTPSVSSLTVSSTLKRKRPPSIQIPKVLQEIQISRPSTSRNDAVSFCGTGVGVSSIRGKKKFMEDAHKIVSCSSGSSNKGFFGVYDGHGGKMAADFVVENLHTNIFEKLENCAEDTTKEEAVKAGYLKTDEEFLKQVTVGICSKLPTGFKEFYIIPILRAVLCRGGVAEALTKDHRAEQEDERKRIEEKGGYVEIHRGAWRIHGVLSVSRSIGDAHLKAWVSAEPDTKILHLTPDMQFLVLASDGLWEKVGNQEAVDTVMRSGSIERKLGPSGGGHFQKENDGGYFSVNTSPASKLRRISLLKQPKTMSQSPSYRITVDSRKEIEEDFACENESPPSKARRISLVKRLNMKTQSPRQEKSYKKSFASSRLVAACKELMNLALTRGGLDDITVMIIDLFHFTCDS